MTKRVSWAKIERIYHAALERSPEERPAFLNEACDGDEELRREVLSLLKHENPGSGFLNVPALEIAARALADGLQPDEQSEAPTRIGTYQLLELLGRGGMGEVHLAFDTRLQRRVAIKLLPRNFTNDAGRVRRFIREAHAASALNHPNIITIHEIGESVTGDAVTHYIVTEYIEGETLRARLANSAQPGEQKRIEVSEAITIALQIGAALTAAHTAGIVHRDIKPENVMVRHDEIVKVLDFGLAKLTEPAAPVFDPQDPTGGGASTEAGLVLGTPRYMSPEQARGEKLDVRSDLFSLGVILYEMIAGRPPFAGITTGEVIAAILRDSPPPLGQYAPDAPSELERILSRALRKNRDERYQNVDELLADLKRLKRRLELKDDLKDELAPVISQVPPTDAPADIVTTPQVITSSQVASTSDITPSSSRSKHRGSGLWRRRLVAVSALIVVVAGAGWFYRRSVKLNRARAALPRIEELKEAERYFEAYDLAVEAQNYLPNDPALIRLMPTIADDLSVVTDPPGAHVYLRRFAPDTAGQFPARQFIGMTPIEHRQIARGTYLLSVEKEGYARLERTVSGVMMRMSGFQAPSPPVRLEAKLIEVNKVPPRMVFVPGGDYRLVSYGRPTHERVQLDDYFIDKYEVTNREYKEFINDQGYLKRELWRHPIVRNGRELTWEDAIRELKDRTGLPGPRNWVKQDFPEGQAEHPVTDITWYEAAAYAEFRGKRLPTVFQWEKAGRDGLAMSAGYVMPWGLFSGTVERRANLDGRGTLPVESLEFGQSPYGCYHMAGNVAEWCRNEYLDGFASAGGSWEDAPHLFGYYRAYPGAYNSSTLGFRCVLETSGKARDEGAMTLRANAQILDYKPAGEASFQSWQEHYRYAQPPLDAQIVEIKQTADWRREKITFAGAEGERAIAYLYLPKHYAPPWQVIQIMPPGNVFGGLTSMPDWVEASQSSFIKSGRAVLAVVLKGYQERDWPPNRTPPSPETIEYRDQILQWVTDERRGLDYVATRRDLDSDRIAYLAISCNGDLKLDLPAIETRYRSVILHGAAFRLVDTQLLPEIRPVNLVPFIKAPKLLLHGRYDEGGPLKSAAEPLQKLLRGPKRIVLYDSGHTVPAEIYVPSVNNWLDETMGPVKR